MKERQLLHPGIAVALLLALVYTAAAQQLTIEADRLSDGIARVTYVLVDGGAGNQYGQFPGNGLTMFDEVLSVHVFELNTKQELPYELVPAPAPQAGVEGLQAVRYTYPNPVPAGGNYRNEISVEGIANFITRDADGRWEFKYNTAWNDVFFVLPLGHAIVYASEPILVYERAGSTVAQVRRTGSTGPRDIIFKTRTDF